MSLGIVVTTAAGLIVIADKRATIISKPGAFRYEDTHDKLFVVNEHCVLQGFHKAHETGPHGIAYEPVRLGSEALIQLFKETDNLYKISPTLKEIIGFEYGEFLQFLPLKERFENLESGVACLLTVGNYNRTSKRFEYAMFETIPIPGEEAKVKVYAHHVNLNQFDKDGIMSFGADTLHPKLSKGLPPFEEESKKDWCQKFLIQRVPAADVSLSEGIAAGLRLFEMVRKDDASRTNEPLMVSKNSDALLLNKKGIS